MHSMLHPLGGGFMATLDWSDFGLREIPTEGFVLERWEQRLFHALIETAFDDSNCLSCNSKDPKWRQHGDTSNRTI